MNYPSRSDDISAHPDWNQNPHHLSSDLTTKVDLNGIVNLREQRSDRSSLGINHEEEEWVNPVDQAEDQSSGKGVSGVKLDPMTASPDQRPSRKSMNLRSPKAFIFKARDVLVKYSGFIGPGFLIAVAYIDPGNYATDVEAGAATRYKHLFIILMSNLFAIFLQSLCIKLGTVTGLNLAENCRKHLPKWLTITLYIFAESAIIATDIAEVVGSAIALNLLLHIPLVAGCAITLVDVLVLLLFYRPDGSMTKLRLFEYFVMALVLGVVICFCIQLSYIQDASVGEVFKGYLPSSAIIKDNGIYLSCGIIGATVMPHSIFLGSGVVQPRLKHFDVQNGHLAVDNSDDEEEKYIPSIYAIRACMKYSIVELGTSLFTFALFVNSAILIVSGASLYPKTEATEADLFGIHDLLSQNLSKAAGTVFALALLLSGTSAGIVCTMAGQMVSEGMLNWTVKPWMRRLITRSISIVPSIIIAGAVGKNGLNRTLTATQVVLSVILPFVTVPLVYFTCRSSIMTVRVDFQGRRGEGEAVNMRNGWLTTALAVAIWLVLVVMNAALLVLVGLGKV
ncbi:manganese transporter [Exophiala aquamarina CBS 119918]|uniref:Manganese transporter n=1 Tax=Exophiala aquamarina CBS 119918 TaxID=1182545 RepID=A0A072PFI0_9EURO|nr:manganese transporter [Exophiala aquamarina CBS 119918]KEF54275.1 manganese transporter [Exophiala aquamarina CBS 119918]